MTTQRSDQHRSLAAGAVRIGPWLFEASRHRIRLGGSIRHLEPKAVAVLARLANDAGTVISKQELLDTAWRDVHVAEEVLTNPIYQLRKAFDDDAREPRYIETIPKAGYRLIAPVAVAAPSAWREQRRRVLAAVGCAASIAGISVWILSTTAKPRRTAELVARGWEALQSVQTDGPHEAALLAGAALALRPESADAWALAAMAQAARATLGDAPDPRSAYDAALAAAERALALDPQHPRALRSRARARWLGAWDWAGAMEDFEAALASDPSSSDTWTDLAELLVFSGQLNEASAAARRALRVAPDSIRAHMTAGLIAGVAGDREAAAVHYRAVLTQQPHHVAARQQLAKLDPAAAPPSVMPAATLAAKDRIRPGQVALFMVETGDEEAALDWLERAVAGHDPTILFFRFDPRWDGLRAHPRFRAAMREAGIPS